MTKGELFEKLKDVPDDREILICGKCADGRKCGNAFGISEDEEAVFVADAVYLQTDIVVDFDYLCTEKTVKENRINKIKNVLSGIRKMSSMEKDLVKLLEDMGAENEKD